MNKDVLVKVIGTQTMPGETIEDAEPISLMTKGTLEPLENGWLLTYEEVFEDVPGVTTNVVKIQKDRIEVTKTGQVSTEMIFEVGKTTITLYDTPFGSMDMGFNASSVEVEETDKQIDVKIAYAMSINNQMTAQCRLDMTIISK
ncbi:MAG: DUF1934 domain-containing protein [Lachnospiraceae bacterium]|nr:DUF1934 domain-containing protein [Candidatus Equihabitans merdae]